MQTTKFKLKRFGLKKGNSTAVLSKCNQYSKCLNWLEKSIGNSQTVHYMTDTSVFLSKKLQKTDLQRSTSKMPLVPLPLNSSIYFYARPAVSSSTIKVVHSCHNSKMRSWLDRNRPVDPFLIYNTGQQKKTFSKTRLKFIYILKRTSVLKVKTYVAFRFFLKLNNFPVIICWTFPNCRFSRSQFF